MSCLLVPSTEQQSREWALGSRESVILPQTRGCLTGAGCTCGSCVGGEPRLSSVDLSTVLDVSWQCWDFLKAMFDALDEEASLQPPAKAWAILMRALRNSLGRRCTTLPCTATRKRRSSDHLSARRGFLSVVLRAEGSLCLGHSE